MADLINVEKVTWRLEALKEIFDEVHTNKILSILVAGVDTKDAKIWRGDNTGVYSTKSNYKYLLKEDLKEREITSQQ